VGAVKRVQTPPGPITDLFVRLDDLHAQAGRPSMREIARRAGRGNVSSSTVHNVFRDSRVPRWDFLERIVNALGGVPRRAEFHTLWDAAWRAQNDLGGPEDGVAGTGRPPGRVGQPPDGPSRLPRQMVSPIQITAWQETLPRQPRRIWSNEIPPQNLNFTGRIAELETIGRNLDRQDPPRVQVISGMGGIGKTELATEYVHRNIDKYDIIWWIRAEHHDRVRDALVSLARRLELRQASPDSDRDRTIAAVLDKLQSESVPNWLLIYDNATNLLDLQKYLAASRPGVHVLVTSREVNWPVYLAADSIELEPFTEEEAISFLRHRVPGLGIPDAGAARSGEEDARRAGDAAQLAEGLGYLPIAIDHAAAYLTETRENVGQYLSRFARNAHSLLAEQPGDQDSHVRVSGTWALSNELLTADARHLFNLCAFFSPEPIAAQLFLQSGADLDDPPGLAEFLSSRQRFRAAENQLHRLSLAKVDRARDLIQMHRVVQAVTQGRLREANMDQFNAFSAAVDTLLAQSNPRNPDRSDSDDVYNLSLQHLESDQRFLRTSNPALRDLIIDQVRRLHLRGAHVEAMLFGQDAMRVWRECHGEDDLKLLAMAVEVSVAMYMGGHVADAQELILQTRHWLQRYPEGDDGFRVFLLCESIYGAVLRARSQFREALDLDLSILPKCEHVFGATHERALNVRNNIAVDYRQLGQFDQAWKTDKRTFEDRRDTLGPTAPLTLYSEHAVARDLRGLGRYEDALDIARRVVNAFEATGGKENPYWLNASEGFAIALRKAGYYWDARQESEHVLQRYRDYLGADHMFTVTAATNLINDRRAVGDLAGAKELARETYERCQRTGPPDDVLYAAQLNLASVLRMTGNAEHALLNDEQARRGLIRIYRDRHPFTLSASINYASDLAACGRLGEAVQVGIETLDKCHGSLGADHPDTLMAAANLSLDEATAGDQVGAERRLSDVLRRYENTLNAEHPDAIDAAQRKRLTAEIEPVV
jgi:tetratricopeptide (TPR) repeat protein